MFSAELAPHWVRLLDRLGDSPVRQVIEDSWRRSQAAGVDRRSARLERVSDADLARRLAANGGLADATRPYLEWISALLAATPHVIYVTDRDGIVLLSAGNDPLMMRTAGLEPGFDWSEARMGTNGAGTALATGQPQAVVGAEHYVEAFAACACTAAPIRDPDGELIGAIDISTSSLDGVPERMLLVTHAAHVIEREFEARTSARRRADAMAMLSHDLRNPLNVIMSSASLLADFDLSEEKKTRQVGLIRSASAAMLRLIEDLLDASRMQAGSFGIMRHPFDVRALLSELSAALSPLMQERRLELEIAVADDVSTVDGDGTRIRQVLDNLLSNAIRHSPEGGRIRVHIDRAGDAHVFTVADEGPGIPENARVHLFEKFWQGGGDGIGGAGLGLAICKGVVEAHGGRIEVDPTVERGATIRFAIPTAF